MKKLKTLHYVFFFFFFYSVGIFFYNKHLNYIVFWLYIHATRLLCI